MHKKRIFAAAAAAAVAVSLSGCTFGTPDSVGKIGDTEFSSGYYLYAQFSAYQSASALTDEEDVLKATLTLEDGSTQKGSDYVAEHTLSTLEYCAAVDSMFARQGLEFTELDEQTAQAQADSIWVNNSSLLEANGIGKESVVTYLRNLVKSTRLIDARYGAEGTESLPDEELWNYINNNFSMGECVNFYMLDYSDYSVLEESEIEKIRKEAGDMAAAIKGGEDIRSAADQYMPAICELMGQEYSEELRDNSLSAVFVTPKTAYQYGEVIGEELLKVHGEDAAVIEDDPIMMVYQSYSLQDMYDLDVLRSTAITEMKGNEFDEEIYAAGKALAHELNSSAMNKLPAGKIKPQG